VDFMLTDSLEAVRPKLVVAKTTDEAALAVDEMFTQAFQNADLLVSEDSGEESDEDERRDVDLDDDEESGAPESPTDVRAPSPDQVVVLSAQEDLGPSEDEENEFAKELSKMVTDASAESRKVDKKTALALWDSAVLPSGIHKRRVDDANDADSRDNGVMNFTVLSKRGTKQQTRQLAVPAESALAVHTRSAQLQSKEEQQHLKRLVLDYEQREEEEELKALEARSRAGAIKIRYLG